MFYLTINSMFYCRLVSSIIEYWEFYCLNLWFENMFHVLVSRSNLKFRIRTHFSKFTKKLSKTKIREGQHVSLIFFYYRPWAFLDLEFTRGSLLIRTAENTGIVLRENPGDLYAKKWPCSILYLDDANIMCKCFIFCKIFRICAIYAPNCTVSSFVYVDYR